MKSTSAIGEREAIKREREIVSLPALVPHASLTAQAKPPVLQANSDTSVPLLLCTCMKVNPCLRLIKANSASADVFGDYLLTKKSNNFR